MELNDYNGFEDHCKANEMVRATIDRNGILILITFYHLLQELLKRKYIHKEPHNNMDPIDHMMQRKDPEFMDHVSH